MGEWIKPRAPHRLSDDARARMQPYYDRIRAAGALIKKECAGKKGTDFRRCRHEKLAAIFGKTPAAAATAAPAYS